MHFTPLLPSPRENSLLLNLNRLSFIRICLINLIFNLFILYNIVKVDVSKVEFEPIHIFNNYLRVNIVIPKRMRYKVIVECTGYFLNSD